MPQFGFTEDEARALVAFLVHLREQKVALSLPSLMSPVERGREVFRKYGCAGCHGADGNGGVPNPNAKTAELVPDLIHVAEGYSQDELKARILKGQREIPALDANRPQPPLYMPAWAGTIKDAEVADLVAYLISLKPKGASARAAGASSRGAMIDETLLRSLGILTGRFCFLLGARLQSDGCGLSFDRADLQQHGGGGEAAG